MLADVFIFFNSSRNPRISVKKVDDTLVIDIAKMMGIILARFIDYRIFCLPLVFVKTDAIF